MEAYTSNLGLLADSLTDLVRIMLLIPFEACPRVTGSFIIFLCDYVHMPRAMKVQSEKYFSCILIQKLYFGRTLTDFSQLDILKVR